MSLKIILPFLAIFLLFKYGEGREGRSSKLIKICPADVKDECKPFCSPSYAYHSCLQLKDLAGTVRTTTCSCQGRPSDRKNEEVERTIEGILRGGADSKTIGKKCTSTYKEQCETFCGKYDAPIKRCRVVNILDLMFCFCGFYEDEDRSRDSFFISNRLAFSVCRQQDEYARTRKIQSAVKQSPGGGGMGCKWWQKFSNSFQPKSCDQVNPNYSPSQKPRILG